MDFEEQIKQVNEVNYMMTYIAERSMNLPLLLNVVVMEEIIKLREAIKPMYEQAKSIEDMDTNKNLKETINMVDYMVEHASDISDELHLQFFDEIIKFGESIRPIYIKAIFDEANT